MATRISLVPPLLTVSGIFCRQSPGLRAQSRDATPYAHLSIHPLRMYRAPGRGPGHPLGSRRPKAPPPALPPMPVFPSPSSMVCMSGSVQNAAPPRIRKSTFTIHAAKSGFSSPAPLPAESTPARARRSHDITLDLNRVVGSWRACVIRIDSTLSSMARSSPPRASTTRFVGESRRAGLPKNLDAERSLPPDAREAPTTVSPRPTPRCNTENSEGRSANTYASP